MKQNWTLIAIIVGLIFAYEALVLKPYNQKYAPPLPAVTQQSNAPVTEAVGATNQTVKESGSPLSISPEQKKNAVAVEINSSRNLKVFSDGTVGDAEFTRYFERGVSTKQNVHVLTNGLHWTSTDPKVNECLRSVKKTDGLSFKGQAAGVSCAINYSQQNLLLGTTVEISSPTEIKGDVIFQSDDGVGKGPQFDHLYLTVKKKDDKVSTIREKKLWQESIRDSGPYDWISWGDKYFSTTILPKGNFNPDLFYQAGAETSDEHHVRWGIAYPLRWSTGNTKLRYDFDVYFALKDLEELRSVRGDLAGTIDFGYFGAIARFMLWSLEALFKVFHNYGIAIIILSLAIRLMLWPINRKMFESGQKMKDIQPQLDAIKKKYADKKDQMLQMNQEVRALYQKSGVNPLGSCLPVVLQIPIFFGLNSALSHSVDLYQAPFFGWITDLSYKDPMYILPIIWTVTLIFSVEFTPQPAAQPGMPDMKWISRAMFLVFGFVSKDFPSGLNLYFLVSNIAGMSQQYLLRRKNAQANTKSRAGQPDKNILVEKER